MSLILKRIADFTLALALLLVLSPIMAVIALLIRAKLGKPVLFRQLRPGQHGKIFSLIKFRTMTEAKGPDGTLLSDRERLTDLGLRLRSLSLDEIPQLWNVLIGDLSFVGPRPLLVQYLPRYTPEQARRHEVKPGITGWAQVNGRNALTWEEKFNLDTWYVDHWSLLLDAKILGMTVFSVLARRGIANPEHATMPEFTGTRATNTLKSQQ
jgi:sugar transferase EpsL